MRNKSGYQYADLPYHYAALPAIAFIHCSLKYSNMNNNNNHEISLQTAIDMTTLYRANQPANFPICETFETGAINKLLATEGCQYLRIYYGMKGNMEADAILVAVNAAGEDMLPAGSTGAFLTADPIILEDGYRCPDACPPPSPLNPE